MNRRAFRLAKVFVTRIQELEAMMLDDAAPDEQEEANRRQELVAKVLLSEVGISDFTAVSLVPAAMPRILPDEPVSDKAMAELAEFLEAQFGLSTDSNG